MEYQLHFQILLQEQQRGILTLNLKLVKQLLLKVTKKKKINKKKNKNKNKTLLKGELFATNTSAYMVLILVTKLMVLQFLTTGLFLTFFWSWLELAPVLTSTWYGTLGGDVLWKPAGKTLSLLPVSLSRFPWVFVAPFSVWSSIHFTLWLCEDTIFFVSILFWYLLIFLLSLWKECSKLRPLRDHLLKKITFWYSFYYIILYLFF